MGEKVSGDYMHRECETAINSIAEMASMRTEIKNIKENMTDFKRFAENQLLHNNRIEAQITSLTNRMTIIGGALLAIIGGTELGTVLKSVLQ